MRKQQITISVIGAHECGEDHRELAFKVGEIVGRVGGILVCGGLDGAMKAACQGCKKSGGTTIGLLPGKDKNDANEFVDIALPTTLGYARNVMVAASADIIIALHGSHGTLCEICYGFVYKRPIIDLGGWKKEGMIQVDGLEALEIKLKEMVEELKQ